MRDADLSFIMGGIVGFMLAVVFGSMLSVSEKRTAKQALGCDAVQTWECK